jgi:hypothetical protein
VPCAKCFVRRAGTKGPARKEPRTTREDRGGDRGASCLVRSTQHAVRGTSPAAAASYRTSVPSAKPLYDVPGTKNEERRAEAPVRRQPIATADHRYTRYTAVDKIAVAKRLLPDVTTGASTTCWHSGTAVLKSRRHNRPRTTRVSALRRLVQLRYSWGGWRVGGAG